MGVLFIKGADGSFILPLEKNFNEMIHLYSKIKIIYNRGEIRR